MTTVPKRVGKRLTYRSAAIIAAFSAMLTGESSARAVSESHSPRVQPVTRDIRYVRPLRIMREKPPPGKPADQKSAGRRPAQPWTIDIPAIGVDVNLMSLGGPTDGPDGLTLPTPPLAEAASIAGWYQFTAVPGAAGNAVIVGHVDTYIGTAVFYNLYQLVPGDAIYVTADGVRQRFDVTSDNEMSKSSFPVSQVFGNTEKHMLWLITCGGAFDYQTRHYLDNIVVSAAWVPPGGK